MVLERFFRCCFCRTQTFIVSRLIRDWQSEKSPPLVKCYAKQWVHFLFLCVPYLCLFPMILSLPFLELRPLKLMPKLCAVAIKLLTTFANSPWHWAIEYSILLCWMLIHIALNSGNIGIKVFFCSVIEHHRGNTWGANDLSGRNP